jgi:hypothetical protein
MLCFRRMQGAFCQLVLHRPYRGSLPGMCGHSGCVGALWDGRAVRVFLYGVTEADAGVYGVVVVGVAAGPAIRASRGEVVGGGRGE